MRNDRALSVGMLSVDAMTPAVEPDHGLIGQLVSKRPRAHGRRFWAVTCLVLTLTIATTLAVITSMIYPPPTQPAVTGLGLAAAGNGECAMLSYMGVFGGLAAISGNTFSVDTFLTGVTASNSGGGWWLGSVYGGLPSFPPLMEALQSAKDPEQISRLINEMWFVPLLARTAAVQFPGTSPSATWKALVHGIPLAVESSPPNTRVIQ